MVCHAGLGAAPDGQPGQVKNSEDVGSLHGGSEAAKANARVQAGDVEYLGEAGATLESVHGDDALQGHGPGGEGVAGAAGQVIELLEGESGAGNVVERGDVGGGEGGGREDAEKAVDAGVAELAVGQAELGACEVQRGEQGAGR